jgi:hypothetical protein
VGVKVEVTIDDVVWYDKDLMVDAAGDIFQLGWHPWSRAWVWRTFGTDAEWWADREHPGAPAKPWRKAALYILDPGQVAKPIGPAIATSDGSER